MTKKVTSYDLWNSWREFNSTGQDQSEGTTSVLSENASGTSSQTLAEKSSSIVAEAGQLAQDLEEIDVGAIRRNPNVKGAYKDVNPVGSDGNPVDLPDTESELVGLYNYLLRMGIDKKEAEKMVGDVMGMLPAQEGFDLGRLLEAACGCQKAKGGACGCPACLAKQSSSIPDEGMMLDYGHDKSDAREGQYARDQLMVIHYLSGLLGNHLHDEDDLPEWVQMYIVQSEQLIQNVFKHLVPRMERVREKEGQKAARPMGNVAIVATEVKNFSPMASRSSASVRKAVKASRKSGGFSSLSLSDMFDDE